jgi:hypothetical protein
VYYNLCHGDTVEGFWASWDNIYDCVFTTSDFPVIISHILGLKANILVLEENLKVVNVGPQVSAERGRCAGAAP